MREALLAKSSIDSIEKHDVFLFLLEMELLSFSLLFGLFMIRTLIDDTRAPRPPYCQDN